MKPTTLVYLYRRRLRAHLAQELLAGLGVAIAVALLFAVTVADGSIASSATEVVHAVIGPANLQLRARGSAASTKACSRAWKHSPASSRPRRCSNRARASSAPTGAARRCRSPAPSSASRCSTGSPTRSRCRPSPANGIGLSSHTAGLIGDRPPESPWSCAGASQPLHVDRRARTTATFGALASAPVAVMALARLQALAGLPGKVTRILVETKPGREAEVRTAAAARSPARKLAVGPADEDVALLHQALRPTDQSSDVLRRDLRAAGLPVRVQRDPLDGPRATPRDRRPAPARRARARRSCRS